MALAGPPSNRIGIGAWVEVVAGGTRQVREVQSAYGYGSQRPAAVHFGVGAARQIEIGVRWPDGTAVTRMATAGRRVVIGHPAAATAVHALTESGPAAFYFEAGYPNPFNVGVTMRFGVAAGGQARMVVYGMNGQRVRTLVD